MLIRDHLAVFLVALTCSTVGTVAFSADTYPSKPVRIFTSEPGVSVDLLARVVAQDLARSLGQPVIVENRAGFLPEQTVARASPDGHTLLVFGPTVWLLSFLQDDVFWDPVKDFTPITWLGSSPNMLAVHPSVPANNVAEFIALAKSKPGDLNYASGTSGTSSHLAAELFKWVAGVNLTRISYKSANAAVIDLLAGRAQLMMTNTGALLTHVRSGKLRALGVATAAPTPLAPGVPTIAASGLPGFESTTMLAMFAPGATPRPIVTRLNREVVDVLRKQEVRDKILGAGIEVVGSSPEQFSEAMKAEMTSLGKVIKETGIRGE